MPFRSRALAAIALATVASSLLGVAASAEKPVAGALAVERGTESSVRSQPRKPSANPAASDCPDPAHMVLVAGNYCPEVRHECAHWLETKGRYAFYRCAEYSSAKCVSKERVPMRFCMDRDEWVAPSESVSANHKSWTDAVKTCGEQGKRVCLESEWNFACEGEEMRPYPYGFARDPDACNADRTDIFNKNGSLVDRRVGPADKPRCVSPFGVHNLSGNLEEWTTLDATAKSSRPRPAMKGAWWQPSRNHCRANQTAHDNFYNGVETGFRCCANATTASDGEIAR